MAFSKMLPVTCCSSYYTHPMLCQNDWLRLVSVVIGLHTHAV